MNQIKISVIVPCYNHAQYLSEALNSVWNQTFEDWECIIVNDGSPDNTEEVAKEWCEKDIRFRYQNKENGGLSSARNAGIQIARGEFILPLDADDIINFDYIKLAIESFSNNTHLSLVYCEAEKFGIENMFWNLGSYSFEKLLINNNIFCSAIFRKEDWEKVKGYDEDLKHGWEDWDFWIRLLNKNSQVYKIPKILFRYRTKNISMITQIHFEHQETIRWKIFIKNIEKYKIIFQSPIYILNENSELKYKFDQISNSKRYRIGNFIFKPISYIKKCLKGFKKQK